jgi:hypothetical protein
MGSARGNPATQMVRSQVIIGILNIYNGSISSYHRYIEYLLSSLTDPCNRRGQPDVIAAHQDKIPQARRPCSINVVIGRGARTLVDIRHLPAPFEG